jgi:hypothetical protein
VEYVWLDSAKLLVVPFSSGRGSTPANRAAARGGLSARSPPTGGAPVDLRPWGGARRTRHGITELLKALACSGNQRAQRIGDGGAPASSISMAAQRRSDRGV